MSKREPSEKPATLFDRVALGFSTGVLALVLGTVFWAIVVFHFRFAPFIPYDLVLYFAGGMAVLGFLLCENVIVALLVGLTQGIFAETQIVTYNSWWVLGAVALIAVVTLWLLTH